jgi:hypothetical protein
MDGSSAATRFREHGETYDSMRRSIRSTSFGKAKRKICERWAKEGVAERPEKLPQKMPCLDPSHEHGRDKKPQSAGYLPGAGEIPVEYHGAESRGDHARVF